MTENYTPKMNARDAVTKCRKVGEVTLELREITPKMAALMLMSNFEGNRKLRKSTVRTYATDMKEGRWEPTTNNVIQIGTDGKVYDGQHRLNAVVLANATVPMYVNLNADPSEYMAYDNGVVRQERDAVPVANATYAQALAKTIFSVEHGNAPICHVLKDNKMGSGASTYPTKAQVRETMISRDDEIQRYVRMGMRASYAIGTGARNTYAKAFYIIHRLCDPIFVDEFIEEICKSVPDDKTVSAMKIAITKAALVGGAAAHRRLSIDWVVATVVRAYEAFVAESGLIRFNRQTEWLKEYDKRLKEWREANRTED